MQIKELVAPDRLLTLAQAKAEELHNAITAVVKRSKNAIEGRLRLARRKNSVHYFHVTDSSPVQGFYIPQSDFKTVRALCQKAYDESALAELNRELRAVDSFIKLYRPEQLSAVYEELDAERKSFAEPVHLSDEQYAAQWLSVKYKGKPFAEESPELVTSRGERVRSKSEVIIANALASLQIPYRYEYPHQLQIFGKGCRRKSRDLKDHCKCDAITNLQSQEDSLELNFAGTSQIQKASGKRGVLPCTLHQATRSTTFHPDFTCLNLHTRREFIWEHFGLMDDPAYVIATISKLEAYIANGVFPGDGLIFTMESQDHPLNPATVERLAKHFLM